MNPEYPIPWEARAAKKREDTLAKIPAGWRLSPADLELAAKQRDLTGPFIERFLEPEVIDIVKTDSVPLVNDIRTGKRSAVEVTKAFCKTAAVAHQIVCIPSVLTCYLNRHQLTEIKE